MSGRALRVGLIGLLALAACVDAGRPGGGGPSDLNDAPSAVVQGGGAFPFGATVVVDGRSSFDPEGGPLAYAWVLAQAPGGAAPTELGAGASIELILEELGRYELALTVTDDHGATASATAVIMARAPAVMVDAGEVIVGEVGDLVVLDGSASSEDGAEVEVGWTLVGRPVGSVAALSDADTLTPSFVVDAEGEYVVTLEGSTAHAAADDQVSVLVPGEQRLLDLELVAIEYAEPLARMILVTSSPSALHVVDPVSGDDTAVALAAAPTSLSIEPGGLRAAVGHDGAITIVDLVAGEVEATHGVSAPVSDLVFDGGGRVHCVPTTDQWVSFHSIDLADGSETLSGNLYEKTPVRLHPVRALEAYGLTRSLGSELEHYDLSGEVVVAVDGPLEVGADPALCDDLWFTNDGTTIVTSCGELFRSSSDVDQDMTYRGSLSESAAVAWADQAGDGVLAALSLTGGQVTIELYGGPLFASGGSLAVPGAFVGDGFAPIAPRLVAYAPDESELFVAGVVGGDVVVLRVPAP